MCDSFTYCPVCQLPLKAINISPDLHVSQCMTRCDDNENEECIKGVHCLSTDVFHYRDFSHKLLADYRSSADFVPPSIDIKPLPLKRKTPTKQPVKRISPKKTRTPTKTKHKNVTSDSESDTDILIQTKKPRRNLKFIEKSHELDSIKSRLKSAKPVEEVSSSLLNKSPKNSASVAQKATAKKNCDSKIIKNEIVSSDQDEIPLSKRNFKHGQINVNMKLNGGKEVTINHSRSQSPLSSISVSSSKGKAEDSDIESGSTEDNKQKKVVNSVSKFILKEPVLKLIDIKKTTTDFTPSENLCRDDTIHKNTTKSNDDHEDIIASKTSVSLSKTDFEDIIPTTTLDKQFLKTLKSKTPSAPVSTFHTISDCDGAASSVLSATEDSGSADKNNLNSTDSPNSPEVVIRPKCNKWSTVFLTSSSDSDTPLAHLIQNKLTYNKEKPFKIGTLLKTESNNVKMIKGKEKSGKMLRNLNLKPVYLNGSSKKSLSGKSEVSANSDKESDSGKSLVSKDSSFIPSDGTSTSQHSDSAFSAEFTDKMTSSTVSSTCTSSDEYTNETQSSDPSYSEGSELNIESKSQLKNRNTPTRSQKGLTKYSSNKHIFDSLSSRSDNTSSDISRKERLFFTKKKKSPVTDKKSIKPKESKQFPTVRTFDNTDNDDKSDWRLLVNKMRNGCFPSDLKIDSEDSLTVVSSCSSSDTSYASTMLPSKQCPFYKKIPDTPFAVDAFQYWNIPGVKVYFLSHFHSDHYIGLKKNFSQPIYCTQITANLVRMKLRVDEKWLNILKLNEPQIIRGVEVTALEANHCPGSVMLLFCLTNGQSYLHVGDFRASENMTKYPSLQRTSISKLFLDTTYCSPQYCFPTQEEVIKRVVEIVQNEVKSHPRTLVVCGSYTIGKEKVFLGVAEALNWKIWARPEKQRIFTCLDDPRINSRLIKDSRSANVHVLPMGSIDIKSLQQHLQSCTGAFTHVVGVKPTGWELNNKSQNFKVTSRDNITIYGVPYSEHSSFSELRDFVKFLQPHEVVPTVNVGNAVARGKMSKYFSEWLKAEGGGSITQTKMSKYFKVSSS